MTCEQLPDGLDSLTRLAPDKRRSRQVAEDCRQRLLRRRAPAAPARGPLAFEDALLGSFCLIYLLAVIRVSLGLG